MTDTRYGRGAAFGAALLAVLTPGLAAGEPPKHADSKIAAAQIATERLDIVSATGTHTFDVEIATTAQQQALGLMFRTSLAADRGMLFHNGKEREITMWMKNTYIPLDMVFIRADGTVHRIAARTEPFSERMIFSEGVVSGVLEIAGGRAEQLGLKPGDKVRHRLFSATP
jgi:uncharacterized membrane protein (UPF0127 family)